ncbi:DMT family transporter [Ruegeria litorea]|uniref:DMT family transporter n=1 Tax=Falsiruegeria litorea TaxID=1280831 RepID=A0ABS5WMC4_9RHOB|nr:DMT family transporter [Falsiruegeria litorea]MBT3140162.1 DMT family transporter [Falsiruegeria litorea]
MTKGVSGFGACNAPSNNVRGILWALLATGLFAVTGAMAKIAVTEYHVLQILFFRQIVVFMSALPAITASFPESLKTHHPGWHAIRLVGAFVALSSGIWAVAVLPLTTAITLGFVQVFFVALLSAQILRERVGAQRLVAICAGFLGVVIILRPGTGGVADWNAFIPIAGAMGAAVAVISVRKLSQTESTATLLAYQSIFVWGSRCDTVAVVLEDTRFDRIFIFACHGCHSYRRAVVRSKGAPSGRGERDREHPIHAAYLRQSFRFRDL